MHGSFDNCLHVRPLSKKVVVKGFSDASWGPGPGPDRRSVSGYCTWLVPFDTDDPHQGVLFQWASRQQRQVALSSAESELYSLNSCVQAGLYVKGLLTETGIAEFGGLDVFCDSSAALSALGRHSTGRMKHLQLADLWVRSQVEQGFVTLHKVCGTANIADGFTKPLVGLSFQQWVPNLGVYVNVEAIHLICMLEPEQEDSPDEELLRRSLAALTVGDWRDRPITERQYEYATDLLRRLTRGEMSDFLEQLVAVAGDRPPVRRLPWTSTRNSSAAGPSSSAPSTTSASLRTTPSSMPSSLGRRGPRRHDG